MLLAGTGRVRAASASLARDHPNIDRGGAGGIVFAALLRCSSTGLVCFLYTCMRLYLYVGLVYWASDAAPFSSPGPPRRYSVNVLAPEPRQLALNAPGLAIQCVVGKVGRHFQSEFEKTGSIQSILTLTRVCPQDS